MVVVLHPPTVITAGNLTGQTRNEEVVVPICLQEEDQEVQVLHHLLIHVQKEQCQWCHQLRIEFLPLRCLAQQ